MIETIEIENFKGTTASTDLKQLNIFRGLSGSGKSTWLEAIRVAVLGHDPGYGKLLSETMAFSSGGSMEITSVTSGVYIKRVFSNKDGKASQKIFINGKGMTAKAAEPLLAENFGQFPMMLNPDEFFKLSDEKKIDFLFGLSSTETDSGYLRRHCIVSILRLYTEAVDYILEYEFEKADYFMMEEDAFANFLGAAIRKVAEKDVPAGRALTKIFSEFLTETLPNGQETLSMYYNTLKEEINAAQRTKRDSESANRKLMEERTEKMNLVSYNEEENAELVEKYREEISEIEKELYSRSKLIAAREKLSSNIEKRELEAEKLKSEMAGHQERILTEEAESHLEKELKSRKAAKVELKTKLVESGGLYNKSVAKMEALMKLGSIKCPDCEADLKCSKCDFSAEYKQEEMDEFRDEQSRIGTHEGTLRSEIKAVEEDIESLGSDATENETVKYAFQAAFELHKFVEINLKDDKKALATLEEPGAATSVLEDQVSSLKKSLSERLVAQKNHDWLRTLSATIARANETINNSKSLSEALKYSLVAVKEIRDELTKSATSVVEEACNELLQKVDPSFNLTYSIADGKFGIRCIGVEGREVDFKTLSGGEQVLYLSAQLLALMTIVDPKLKILEVEMGELSGNLVPPFMDALEAMTEGKGIQVVLSSCHGDFEVSSDSWAVHQMGEEL